MADRTTNNLDAIASLPFSALSGPEAGEVIRDGLIAEIRWLRADLAIAQRLLRGWAGLEARGDNVVQLLPTGHYDGHTADPEGAEFLRWMEVPDGAD